MSGDDPIPYGRQTIDDADIQAVIEVMKGDWLTQGPTIEHFERAIADYVDAEHAIAFTNGTAALHGACAAAGLGAGDVVATSPLTFVASANCARYVGADVTLVDIDPATLNIDLERVPEGIDALVAVHFAGLPVDLSELRSRPRVVIEDAAQALGASTPDGRVGNCARSDMTCFSLHPVKPITTGEGGVVTTNDDELAARLRRFRNHGIERRPERGGWYYEVVDLGYNYRLTDIQAALGLSQLPKLEGFIGRRQEIAAEYDVALRDLPVIAAPRAPDGFRHGYHLYPVRVPERHRVYDLLRACGIYTQVHYVPVHHHPAFRQLDTGLPETNKVYDEILTLPIFPSLTDADVERVVSSLTSVITDVTSQA